MEHDGACMIKHAVFSQRKNAVPVDRRLPAASGSSADPTGDLPSKLSDSSGKSHGKFHGYLQVVCFPHLCSFTRR